MRKRGKGCRAERKGTERKKKARSFPLQTALCPMRQRGLPALISSKTQSREKQEREEGRKLRKGENANLGRSSEAPENIGHWPIFPLRRKEDLLCVKTVLLIQKIKINHLFLTILFSLT